MLQTKPPYQDTFKMSSMMNVPVSTHVVESAVIRASPAKCWQVLSQMDFNWWKIVSSSALVSGASPQTLDATTRLNFKDGLSWTIQLREVSSIQKSVTFEVITCEPAASVSSVIHTITLKKITTEPTSTYVEWVTDFSSDATAETVMDSSFKRKDAFGDLAVTASAL